MKLGLWQNGLQSSPGLSFDGSFRKRGSGFQNDDFNSTSRESFRGSFRKSKAGSEKLIPTSKGIFRGPRNLVDLELFTQAIEDWVLTNSCSSSTDGEQCFKSPFSFEELRKLDYALDGILFKQLFRMPLFSPYDSNDLKEEEFLSLEDFLHTIVDGLWHTFWDSDEPFPFFISCPLQPGSKFYTIEKAISRGRLKGLSGAALMTKNGSDLRAHWDQVVEFVLFKRNILVEKGLGISSSTICEALFYGFHILMYRSLSKYRSFIADSVFILVLDSKFGGVVKLSGDIGKLEIGSGNPYKFVSDWIKLHAEVSVSPIDRIWNRLGNPNWGDLGMLQILLATFNSIVQFHGPPIKSIASLAADHSLRLQKRRTEWRLAMLLSGEGDIVELDNIDIHDPSFEKDASQLKLKQGEILLLDDHLQGQKSFQVEECLVGGNCYCYAVSSLENPRKLLTLYVGAHPSRLEPSWEAMSLWYEVQRQTKVLKVLKQKEISSEYLPEFIASGRILHSGPCGKPSPNGICEHPWCGTPSLVTSPVGEPVSFIVSRSGPFTSDEAIRCCHDCLSALKTASMANIQHGCLCPENVSRVFDPEKRCFYVLVSWGRAVLEERDSPAINLQFSSSYALQNGKLCPSSDAENLVYLLYFVCGGFMQQQDSIESALEWREKCWSKRLIQQHLGEVSALLKAFSDYVDSICGTPYPVNYDIWLSRLSRAVNGRDERGKMVEEEVMTIRLQDTAESSGISGSATSFS